MVLPVCLGVGYVILLPPLIASGQQTNQAFTENAHI